MPNTLLDGLQHHWKLDTTGGADAHGGATLTEVNSPSYAFSGKVYTNAVRLDGSSQYLYVADQTSFGALSGTSDWTLALWVLAVSLSSTNFVASQWSSTAGDRGWAVSYSLGANFRGTVSTNGTTGFNAMPSGTPSAGVWYCVIVWRPASSELVYCSVNNGTAATVDIGTSSTTINDSSLNWMIGNRSGTSASWPGQIEGVSLWNRDIGSSDRAAYYNAGSGLAYESWTASGGGGGLSIPVAMNHYRRQRGR